MAIWDYGERLTQLTSADWPAIAYVLRQCGLMVDEGEGSLRV